MDFQLCLENYYNKKDHNLFVNMFSNLIGCFMINCWNSYLVNIYMLWKLSYDGTNFYWKTRIMNLQILYTNIFNNIFDIIIGHITNKTSTEGLENKIRPLIENIVYTVTDFDGEANASIDPSAYGGFMGALKSQFDINNLFNLVGGGNNPNQKTTTGIKYVLKLGFNTVIDYYNQKKSPIPYTPEQIDECKQIIANVMINSIIQQLNVVNNMMKSSTLKPCGYDLELYSENLLKITSFNTILFINKMIDLWIPLKLNWKNYNIGSIDDLNKSDENIPCVYFYKSLSNIINIKDDTKSLNEKHNDFNNKIQDIYDKLIKKIKNYSNTKITYLDDNYTNNYNTIKINIDLIFNLNTKLPINNFMDKFNYYTKYYKSSQKSPYKNEILNNADCMNGCMNDSKCKTFSMSNQSWTLDGKYLTWKYNCKYFEDETDLTLESDPNTIYYSSVNKNLYANSEYNSYNKYNGKCNSIATKISSNIPIDECRNVSLLNKKSTGFHIENYNKTSNTGDCWIHETKIPTIIQNNDLCYIKNKNSESFPAYNSIKFDKSVGKCVSKNQMKTYPIDDVNKCVDIVLNNSYPSGFPNINEYKPLSGFTLYNNGKCEIQYINTNNNDVTDEKLYAIAGDNKNESAACYVKNSNSKPIKHIDLNTNTSCDAKTSILKTEIIANTSLSNCISIVDKISFNDKYPIGASYENRVTDKQGNTTKQGDCKIILKPFPIGINTKKPKLDVNFVTNNDKLLNLNKDKNSTSICLIKKN